MRHLQSFKYIKAIVEAGSIRGAAESLTISPSALNRHIQNLELDLDFSLFERLSKGVRLSPEGELFYSYALTQIAGFDRVQNQIENIKGLNVGKLRLGISQDIYLGSLTMLISQFQRENAHVDLEVCSVNQDRLFDALSQQEIDLAFFVNPILRKGIQVHHAKDISLTAFVPVGTGIAKSDTLNTYDLAGCRVAVPPADSEVTRRVMAATEKSGIEVLWQYKGPQILEYLEASFAPVVGIVAMASKEAASTTVLGYRRIPMNLRHIGNCSLCLVGGESFGMSRAAYAFQEIASGFLD